MGLLGSAFDSPEGDSWLTQTARAINPESYALDKQQQAQQKIQGLFSDPANANLPIDQIIRKAASIDPAYAKQLIDMEMARSKA